MKLSDEKLRKLLTPLITKEVASYGLERIKIEGKLDQGGDEAIYIDVWLKENDFERGDVSFAIYQAVGRTLQDEDDRLFHYVNLHTPPFSKERMQNMIEELRKSLDDLLVTQ